MDLKTEIASIQERIEAIRGHIRENISNLPDNPKIKRIAPKCFVAQSSELFKNNNWSQEFHDFKAQYKAILEYLENIKDIKEFIPKLKNVLEKGFIQKNQYKSGKFKISLHPDVIKNVENCSHI